MFKRLPITVIAVFCSAVLFAQTSDYNFRLGVNPLLTSGNMAGISTLKGGNMSYAEVLFVKDNGGFTGVDGSGDSWEAKADAESYTRISDRMVFFGKLSYSYFKGQQMGGSVFRDLDYNPVCFLESSPESAGVKTKETYLINGGISYSPWERWSFGVGIDYESGNYVKTKDPRYRSEWMNLHLSAGFLYRSKGNFSAGMSLIFKNTQELVKEHLYGTTDQTYYASIDRGGFFGTIENFDSTYGFLSSNEFQPMTNKFFGAAIQLSGGRAIRSYNDIRFLYRKGKYGKDTSSYPVYFEFSGPEVSYDGKLLMGSAENVHDIHYGVAFRNLNNNENTIRYSTKPGQNTVVEYAGQKQVLNRSDITANLGYKASLGVSDNLPSIQFGIDVDAFSRWQKTTLYPFYRKHSHTSIFGRLFFEKNMISKSNIYTVGVDACLGGGFGVAAEDGQMAGSSSSSIRSFDYYLDRQFEYDTAIRTGAGLSFTYTRIINGTVSAYIRLNDNFVSMLKTPEYLSGPSRNTVMLTLGCRL